MARTEDFQALLDLCVPEGETEERWAILNDLSPRTLRRAKQRGSKLYRDTLKRLAKAMRRLGGKFEARIERIQKAALPRRRRR